MGIFNTLLGNATSVDVQDIVYKLKDIFYEGEEVCYAFSYVRDMFLFTSGRLIFIDKQGVTGKKTEFYSIPYKSISRFSIETTGHLDDDSEIKIWINGVAEPIVKQLSGNKNLEEVQKVMAKVICKG